MRISTGQMAKIIMQTLQGAKDVGGQLELKVGTVVKATLLDFLGNKSDALLQIGNTKVRAQVDANLQPGDQLELLVTGEQKSGAMELKLIGQPVRGEAGRTMQLDLAGILNAMQLPDGEEMKALVQEFVGRNLSLNPETLKGATQVLRAQGGTLNPTQVATIGKMVELGIPLTQATFQALNALDNGPKLHQLLENVAAKLQDLLPELAGEGKNSAPAPVAQQTRAVPSAASSAQSSAFVAPTQRNENMTAASGRTEQLTGTRVQGAPTPEQSPETVRTSAGNATSATPLSAAQTTAASPTPRPPSEAFSASARSESFFPGHETARPLQTTLEGTAAKAESPLPAYAREHLRQLAQAVHDLVAQGDVNADSLRDKAKQLGLALEERIGTALRRLSADSDPATVRDAVQNALRNFAAETQGTGLKDALLNVQKSVSDLTSAGHAALADDVSALLNNLTGQQLMSTPGQTSQRSDLFYQFAAVPLQLNGREQTVELHVMSRKGPGQKSLDPANCYILFRLDMPNLGPLDIHLHIVDRVVGIRFVAEDKDAVQIEAADQRELRDKLQGVGFHLGVMKSEEKQPPQDGKRLPLLPPLLTQGSFDLRM